MGLTASPVAHVERTYLDTVDWRLFGRGEVLVEERYSVETGALVLQNRTGERSDLVVRTSTQPRSASELPGGLRQRLGSVLTPRPLVNVGYERAEVWPLRLLDGDGKTVAHVDVERVEREETPPIVRVQLRTVRGYDRVARQLRIALDSQADLSAAEDPMVVAARGAGGEPGVVPGPPPLQLEPAGRSVDALAEVLGHLLATLAAHEDGVRQQLDPEVLHDFRVAIRRTRSAVRLARHRLPDDVAKVWETEWEWLTTVTNTPRDLDVLLEEIERARPSLPANAKAGLDELRELIVARRAAAQRALQTALAGDRYGTLKRGWRVGISELGGQPRTDDATAKSLAGDMVARATKQLVRHAEAINAESPAEAIHDVRKRTKRLRYALELFGPLLPRRQVKADVRVTKRLQDDLGEFQDNEVYRQLVAQLLEGSHGLSADAITAGHLLIERFDERHTAARRALPDQVRRFLAEMSASTESP